jgi:hypothetical protein
VALIFERDIHLMIAHRKSAMFELVQLCTMISCIVVPLAEQRIDPIAQQTQVGRAHEMPTLGLPSRWVFGFGKGRFKLQLNRVGCMCQCQWP